MEKYFRQFENCRQKEEPACTNACPFHLDVKDFQDKISRNKYDRAYKLYRDTVVFPEIVSRICDAPCEKVCPRKDHDGAVQLRLLEYTAAVKAKRKEPSKYNLPKKEQRIGIIGAGLSGLACGLRLATKKYSVTFFEKEKFPGGQLRGLMPEEEYLADIDLQMSKEEYEMFTEIEITSLEQIKDYGFDALYVATGQGGTDFGLAGSGEYDFGENKRISVWTGGSLRGKDTVTAIVDGVNAAAAIDLYIKTGKGEIKEERRETKVVPNLSKIKMCPPVEPAKGNVLSDDEVIVEAGRCIRCQCDTCWSRCDMVSYYNKWPSKMREEVAETVMESGSMLRKSPATYLVNTCTQCGLFEDGCPAAIDMKAMMLQTRKILHKQHQMPPAFHGFWLDDMEHANGQASSICKNAPGSEKSEYVFFPGCNLGASQPEYVEKVYGWLNKNFNDMGLLLRCCGIHAEWAGNEDLTEKLKESFISDWKALGEPLVVASCPSCIRHLSENMPEIPCISLYEFLMQKGKVPFIEQQDMYGDIFAVFDPCAARKNEKMKEAVRRLLDAKEIQTVELEPKDQYGCCGFGGDISIASPEFADYVAEKRISMSEEPYITYCINCRDVFVDKNKKAIHILDVLFGIDGIIKETPDYTMRRRNRERLKKSLLDMYWGEQMDVEKTRYEFDVVCNDEINKKMRSLHLVEEDLKEVISRANILNRRIYNEETGEYTCYSKLNYITCWVRYKLQDDKYYITNVYTHRMDIKLEEVWNGKKVKTDL